MELLRGKYVGGARVVVELEDGALVFRAESSAEASSVVEAVDASS